VSSSSAALGDSANRRKITPIATAYTALSGGFDI
jgi:hypothetical protein